MEVKELYTSFEQNFDNLVIPYIRKNLPRSSLSEPFWYILEKFNWRKFRSGIVINLARGYGVPIEKIMPLAAASEIIFGVSLIQDDIIDRDERRGDHPAAHMIFGIPHTVASCDYILAFVNEMLESLNSTLTNEAAKRNRSNFIHYQKELYASFILELVNSGKSDFSIEDIFDIYLKKTSTGINASYCAALICDKAPKCFAKDVLEYSKNLAIAGQIKNDIYDLVDWQKYPEIRGYSDLKNGYITYALRKLLDKSTKEEKYEIINSLNVNNSELIIRLIKKYSIIEGCIDDCKLYADKAIARVTGKYPEVEETLLAWANGHKQFNKLT